MQQAFFINGSKSQKQLVTPHLKYGKKNNKNGKRVTQAMHASNITTQYTATESSQEIDRLNVNSKDIIDQPAFVQPVHQFQNQQEQFIATIRQCLDVMVDQTQTVDQFYDSIQFLANYRHVQIEFLQRLLNREVIRAQSHQTSSNEKGASILVDEQKLEESSIQFDYNYTSENITNISLLKELSSSASLVELALHKLASLVLVGVADYDQVMPHEIQTHIALFLVDQLNVKEAQLAKKWTEIDSKRTTRSSSAQSPIISERQPTILSDEDKENYLDWSLKVDLKKNKERSIQTSPITIDGQAWAFLLDLGNEDAQIGTFSQQDKSTSNNTASSSNPDEHIWFKMSVILCPLQEFAQQKQEAIIQNSKHDIAEKALKTKQTQLQSKRCKFIRKKSITGMINSYNSTSPAIYVNNRKNSSTRSGKKSDNLGGFNSTFGNQQDTNQQISSNNHETQSRGEIKPQIFSFELCAEVVIEGTGRVEWVTLQPEIVTSLRSPRGYPNVLFQLPKYLIEPVIHSDSVLNLKIKFVQDFSLTAGVQYLQSKLNTTTQKVLLQQQQPSLSVDNYQRHQSSLSIIQPHECFLFDTIFTGDHISKVLQVLEVPGDIALRAVQNLVVRQGNMSSFQEQQRNSEEINSSPEFQTPHKVISLKQFSSQLAQDQPEIEYQNQQQYQTQQEQISQFRTTADQQQDLTQHLQTHTQQSQKPYQQPSIIDKPGHNTKHSTNFSMDQVHPNKNVLSIFDAETRRSVPIVFDSDAPTTGENNPQFGTGLGSMQISMYQPSHTDISSQYYMSLLAEKEREIKNLQNLLENHRRDENVQKVARKILDQPTVTHSGRKGTHNAKSVTGRLSTGGCSGTLSRNISIDESQFAMLAGNAARGENSASQNSIHHNLDNASLQQVFISNNEMSASRQSCKSVHTSRPASSHMLKNSNTTSQQIEVHDCIHEIRPATQFKVNSVQGSNRLTPVKLVSLGHGSEVHSHALLPVSQNQPSQYNVNQQLFPNTTETLETQSNHIHPYKRKNYQKNQTLFHKAVEAAAVINYQKREASKSRERSKDNAKLSRSRQGSRPRTTLQSELQSHNSTKQFKPVLQESRSSKSLTYKRRPTSRQGTTSQKSIATASRSKQSVMKIECQYLDVNLTRMQMKQEFEQYNGQKRKKADKKTKQNSKNGVSQIVEEKKDAYEDVPRFKVSNPTNNQGSHKVIRNRKRTNHRSSRSQDIVLSSREYIDDMDLEPEEEELMEPPMVSREIQTSAMTIRQQQRSPKKATAGAQKVSQKKLLKLDMENDEPAAIQKSVISTQTRQSPQEDKQHMIAIPESNTFSDTFAKVTANMPIPDEFDYVYEFPGETPLRENMFITNINRQASRNHIEKQHQTDKSQEGNSQSPMIISQPYLKKEPNNTDQANQRKLGYITKISNPAASKGTPMSLSHLLNPSENLGPKTLKEMDGEMLGPQSTIDNAVPNIHAGELTEMSQTPCETEFSADDKLWNSVDYIFTQQGSKRNGMISVAQAREVIRKLFVAELGFEPGEGMLMNFFDDIKDNQGQNVSRQEMFNNLKKLKN